jgi:hypothetical protein
MKQLQLCVHSCPSLFIEEQVLSEDLRSFLARFISKVELGYYQARIHYTFPLESIDPNMLYPSRGTFFLKSIAKSIDIVWDWTLIDLLLIIQHGLNNDQIFLYR